MNDIPVADQVPGAPHPRETPHLFGQQAAERAFLEAYASGRLHHAWLLTGPRGVGKATLAWRIARFLLATPPVEEDGLFGAPPPPETLDISPEHPVAHRLLAGSDPGLITITRSVNDKTGRLRDEIVVDDVRVLNRFFGLSATDGGRRVVIVDCADDMNVNAANALLKMLEEPPARTTLLLVSHRPSGLLPTIRSRCRTLRLSPLSPQDMAAALEQAGVELSGNADHMTALAAGSVGAALRLTALGGLDLYGELIALLSTLPRLDRPRALALADTAAQRGAGDRFDLLLDLIDTALARLARTGAAGQPPQPEAARGEAETLTRLAPNAHCARAWADTAAEITARSRHGKAVNLDPAALVLDTVFKMQKTAAG
ncbi:DNA polymerase III subunit delta' [Pseudodonghicola xiamenensis]|uniref:DNA polymerase III subunit delta n=1 Tax=Pseudodonghicola xiamenensis TaxID=337702 RepID=A0A8J3MD82_9RHOB|nr:DNA polymerase III subunit delta' [Pseudodonghicola xiamenensis]GHG93959.1 DNA polymerase III subunit delta' [Pseudodonghicola xiamenensis]